MLIEFDIVRFGIRFQICFNRCQNAAYVFVPSFSEYISVAISQITISRKYYLVTIILRLLQRLYLKIENQLLNTRIRIAIVRISTLETVGVPNNLMQRQC